MSTTKQIIVMSKTDEFSSKTEWEEEIAKRIKDSARYPLYEWAAVIIKRPNIKTTMFIEMD